jgi:parallel beta-helix repeat protein
MGFGTMERREKVKRLNWVLLMGAVLLLGVTALGACPPGAKLIDATTVGDGAIDAADGPGTYCVPSGGFTGSFTIQISDVVIVGETPNATITGDITINGGLMNVVLRSFRLVGQIIDNGAYQLLIDGLTVVPDNAPAITLSGYQPTVRNCTFRVDTNAYAYDVIELAAGGMNAKIYGNNVIGIATSPVTFVYFTATSYNGLELYNNTANMLGYLLDGSGCTLTNSVIRDNTATIYDTHGIYLETGANVEIRGNRLIVGQDNVVYALIHTEATNITIIGNTLDASLGLVTREGAIYTAGPNTTINANTVLGAKDAPAIYIAPGAVNATVTNNTVQNVVDPNPAGAIYVEEMNAKIQANIVDGVSGTDCHAVYLAAGNGQVLANTIKNVDDGVGIYVDGVMNNVIQGNTLENIGQDGILLYDTDADNNTVKGNTLRKVALRAVVTLGDPAVGDYAAIRVQGDNNVLDGNIIEDVGGLVWPAWSCGIDIEQTGSMNNSILNNKIRQFTPAGNISSAAIGILVRAGMNHIVQGNELSNTGNMQIGIDIRTTDRMTVKENKVEGMVYAGLYLRGGTVTNRLTVEGNKLTNNYIGIILSAGAADLTGNVVSGGWTSLLVDRFGVAGQYKLENNCFIKPTGVHVRNDGTGTLTAKKSYWEPTPPSVVGAVDTSDPLASCPGAPAPTPTLSKNYGPRAGWYMVSVPTTGDTAGIFGVTLYWWNGTSYTSLTGTAAIEPVKGYWANLPANKTVTASGTIPTTDQTIALVKGWNMISVPWAYPKAAIQVQKGTETKSWADAVAAGWVRDTIWGYDGAYQSVTTLDPWYGYWVRALVDGLSLKFAYASRLTTLCVSCLEAKAVVPEGEELPPAPPAASAAEFKFVNVPNPIRDVHTTTFKVLGPLSSMVTEIKVQVFDLTGKLVWEGTASGAELTWHTDDLTGAYLANGVYLYKVYVKVGDAWISSGVLKLVIQR